MCIIFFTDRPISKKKQSKLEKEFGYEIALGFEEDRECEYTFGYSQENVGEDGCCEEDPLPFEEAVRCCGILWREGIQEFGIEGNGEWAMGMIRRTDFTNYAVPIETKLEWARTAKVFWTEADPSRIPYIRPAP